MYAEFITQVLKLLSSLISKKLVVWVVATVAMFTNYIDSTLWGAITLGYIGLQGAIDWRGVSPPQPTTTTTITVPPAQTEEPVQVTVSPHPTPVVVSPEPSTIIEADDIPTDEDPERTEDRLTQPK